MKQTTFTDKNTSDVTFYIDKDEHLKGLRTLNLDDYDRFIIVIDQNIAEDYLELVLNPLKKFKKDLKVIEIRPTEINKGLDQSIKLIKELETSTVGRYDLIISIGGGFISDIVSFVASIYMRGIPYVAIPTTLIGQVDAVTAGKTCINGPETKNLLGTFYFPSYVYNNINFLETLPIRELRQGWSEIFKYALLDSKNLLSLLSKYFSKKQNSTLIEIIEETIRVRLKIRRVDPLSSNLGHTFGHAFEKISNYRISHGDAIASGILMATKFGEEVNISKSGLHDRVYQLMTEFSLNVNFHPDFDPKKVSKIMLRDKKSSSTRINLVLLKDIAEPYYGESLPFYSTDEDTMSIFIQNYFAERSDRLNSDLYNVLS